MSNSAPEETFDSNQSDEDELLTYVQLKATKGFGDDKNPNTESVDLLEESVPETETSHKAMEIEENPDANQSVDASEETLDDNQSDEDELLTDVHAGADSAGRKGLFTKELRHMMHGFGDGKNPYTESVELLEDIILKFITDTTQRAMEVGKKGEVETEDLLTLFEGDPEIYIRVKELVAMNETLEKAIRVIAEKKNVDSETESE